MANVYVEQVIVIARSVIPLPKITQIVIVSIITFR